MAKQAYRYVDNVAGGLANGRPLEPGEYVELTVDEVNDLFNADLIARDKLIPVEDKHVRAAERVQKDQEKEAQEIAEAREEDT